jgi:c(7)-type cytochrome triheme protein
MNGRIITFFAAVIVMLMTVPVQAKDIRFSFKNASAVVFSHDTHLAKNKDCKTCHSAIFNLSKEAHLQSMAEMEKGLSCGTCHNGKKAFSVATEKDCSKCHRGTPSAITYRIRLATPCSVTTPMSMARDLAARAVTRVVRSAVVSAWLKWKKASPAVHATTAKQPLRPQQTAVPATAAWPQKPSNTSQSRLTTRYSAMTSTSRPTSAATATPRSLTTVRVPQSHHGRYGKREILRQLPRWQDRLCSSTGDCNKCHVGYKPANLTFKNSRGTVVGYFSHDFHTAAYQCSDCHTKTFPYGGAKRVTMKDMGKGKSCGACHDGKTAFCGNRKLRQVPQKCNESTSGYSLTKRRYPLRVAPFVYLSKSLVKQSPDVALI